MLNSNNLIQCESLNMRIYREVDITPSVATYLSDITTHRDKSELDKKFYEGFNHKLDMLKAGEFGKSILKKMITLRSQEAIYFSDKYKSNDEPSIAVRDILNIDSSIDRMANAEVYWEWFRTEIFEKKTDFIAQVFGDNLVVEDIFSEELNFNFAMLWLMAYDWPIEMLYNIIKRATVSLQVLDGYNITKEIRKIYTFLAEEYYLAPGFELYKLVSEKDEVRLTAYYQNFHFIGPKDSKNKMKILTQKLEDLNNG